MLKNSKKKLRKLGAFSLVLAQVAAVGVVAPMTSASAFAGSAITRNMENLDRGVVATKTDDGVLISWRRLATEPADTTFTLYRNQEKINEGAVTNFVDASGTVNDKYTVVANGEMSDSVGVWENGYLDIPLAKALKVTFYKWTETAYTTVHIHRVTHHTVTLTVTDNMKS